MDVPAIAPSKEVGTATEHSTIYLLLTSNQQFYSCKESCGNFMKTISEQCDDGKSHKLPETPVIFIETLVTLEVLRLCEHSKILTRRPVRILTTIPINFLDNFLLGNKVGGDGCSGSCTIEIGYNCTETLFSYCFTVCGDGRTISPEQCTL